MDYFQAPVWNNCPKTDRNATPQPQHRDPANGRHAIEIRNKSASYRSAVVDGIFLISQLVDMSKLKASGRQYLMIECCWHGHRLPHSFPKFGIDMANATVLHNYTGLVETNIA